MFSLLGRYPFVKLMKLDPSKRRVFFLLGIGKKRGAILRNY
jgi:hypothetical protein